MRKTCSNASITLIVTVIFGLQGEVAQAQSCLPPIAPENFLSDQLIQEYEPEIRQEYQDYFDSAQSFFRCLSQLNVEVQKEVAAVIEQYERAFPDG